MELAPAAAIVDRLPETGLECLQAALAVADFAGELVKLFSLPPPQFESEPRTIFPMNGSAANRMSVFSGVTGESDRDVVEGERRHRVERRAGIEPANTCLENRALTTRVTDAKVEPTARIERATSTLQGWRYYQLSYVGESGADEWT